MNRWILTAHLGAFALFTTALVGVTLDPWSTSSAAPDFRADATIVLPETPSPEDPEFNIDLVEPDIPAPDIVWPDEPTIAELDEPAPEPPTLEQPKAEPVPAPRLDNCPACGMG